MNNIAARYANVLLQLAVEANVLTHVYADMQCLDQVCDENECLVSAMKNPTIEQRKKLALLQAIFQNKVHTLTLNFLAIVIQKHRAALLPTMIQVFLTQYDQHQSIQTANVTTTFPLSDPLMEQLRQIVQKISPCRHVILEQTIDPALVGGYVLRVEDKKLDHSLRKKLLTLQKNCMTARY